MAINTIIPYEHFEMAPIETMEYITCYYPEWLEKMASALCGVSLGTFNALEAIMYIKHDILNEEIINEKRT